MSRIVNPDSTGKQRNQLRRTIAEMLYHVMQKAGKGELDDDVRDMLATVVFSLREIDEGIEQSAQAWENRDYWMKAEELRNRWHWAGMYGDELGGVLLQDNWASLPPLLTKIHDKFKDVKVTKFTRKASDWKGAYARLMREKSPLS